MGCFERQSHPSQCFAEKRGSGRESPDHNAVVVDGMNLVHRVKEHVTEILPLQSAMALKEGMGCSRIDVVFDTYKEVSIKNTAIHSGLRVWPSTTAHHRNTDCEAMEGVPQLSKQEQPHCLLSRWMDETRFHHPIPNAPFVVKVIWICYLRPVLAFGYCRCLRLCVGPCVNHEVVCVRTHDPFQLGSPNFDHRCKRTWLRSLLFWEVIDYDLQGKI